MARVSPCFLLLEVKCALISNVPLESNLSGLGFHLMLTGRAHGDASAHL